MISGDVLTGPCWAQFASTRPKKVEMLVRWDKPLTEDDNYRVNKPKVVSYVYVVVLQEHLGLLFVYIKEVLGYWNHDRLDSSILLLHCYLF